MENFKTYEDLRGWIEKKKSVYAHDTFNGIEGIKFHDIHFYKHKDEPCDDPDFLPELIAAWRCLGQDSKALSLRSLTGSVLTHQQVYGHICDIENFIDNLYKTFSNEDLLPVQLDTSSKEGSKVKKEKPPPPHYLEIVSIAEDYPELTQKEVAEQYTHNTGKKCSQVKVNRAIAAVNKYRKARGLPEISSKKHTR